MKPYTFFKHDGSGVTPGFDLGEFENDGEARNHALSLLAVNPQYTAVEVWDGINDPFTARRPSAGGPDVAAGKMILPDG